MKRIAIIGGGWYGCYIAEYLLEKNSNINITIFDMNDDIFCGSSYNNQSRLHLGYHYPRCNVTYKKCEKNYTIFLKKYGMLIENIDKNYYVISKNSSIKYDDYLKLYNKDNHKLVENTFMNNIEGNIINTNEKYIDYKKSKEYFKTKLLTKINFVKNYTVTNIKNIKNGVQINNEFEFDNVFNCTYNQLGDGTNVLYEKCLSLIYNKKTNDVPFDCLTIMDGNYSSIYKYNNDNQYTLTNVEYTPLLTKSLFEDVNTPYEYNIEEKIKLFEEKIITYYPDFKKKFEYDSFFESFKCKNISTNDSRDININIDEKIFNVWCGKISFIFELDKYINEFMNL